MDGSEEAEDLKHSITFSIYDPDQLELENFRKRYFLSIENVTEILSMVRDSIKEIANEVLKSIHTIRAAERPHTIYISGGASLFKDTEKILFDLTGFNYKRYDFLDVEQEMYINCISMGYHYRQRKQEQVNFLTEEFSKRLNKNLIKFSNFKAHIILLFLSFVVFIIIY